MGNFLGSFTFLIIIMYYFKEFSGKKNLFFNYSFEEGENNNIVDLSFEEILNYRFKSKYFI